MKLFITHTTTYTYDAPVTYGLQQVRLTPLSNTQQTVLDWSVQVEGGAEELSFLDQHQNHTILVQATPGVTELKLTASGTVETHDNAGVLGPVYGTAPLWHFLMSTPRTEPGKGIRKLSRVLAGNGNQIDLLHALSQEIRDQVPYRTNNTFFDTTAEDALSAAGGVCQDHSQIFIAACRLANFPARYVSGYLMINGQVDQDASHAWAEVHVDGLGWVGFDVSNVISPDERYVRIATGLDSRDAAPISGLHTGPSEETMVVTLQVEQQ